MDEMVVPPTSFSAKHFNFLFARQVWGIWGNKIDNVTHIGDREWDIDFRCMETWVEGKGNCSVNVGNYVWQVPGLSDQAGMTCDLFD